MKTTNLSKFAICILTAVLAGVSGYGGSVIWSESSGVESSDEQALAALAPDVLFTNLTRTPGANYDASHSKDIIGNNVRGETESWEATRFRPRVSGQATVVSAAIGYFSGTKLVTLGIYSDDEGQVGTLLAGGLGSTSTMPDAGDCCGLATVVLPEPGVSLASDTYYWLVVEPDDVNAPDFHGLWRVSNLGLFCAFSSTVPPDPQPSSWDAMQIRGTKSQNDSKPDHLSRDSQTGEAEASGNSVIFSNLDRIVGPLYVPGAGVPLYGKDVMFAQEEWNALPFTPRTDVHAKTLGAAIAYISGTKKINLGIYSDADGLVGTLLPGAQGSTTNIPTIGECCEMTRVKLAGAGVALSRGVQYWLVASTDASSADFKGVWDTATISNSSYQEPDNLPRWTTYDGHWLAAEIRGTNP